VLGSGDGVSAGRVEHDDAATRGGFDIDVVYAHAGATDSAQRFARLQNSGGDPSFASDNNGAELWDDFRSSASLSPVFTTTSIAWSRDNSSTPRGEMESAMRTFGAVMK